jgi:hypothetical protein
MYGMSHLFFTCLVNSSSYRIPSEQTQSSSGNTAITLIVELGILACARVAYYRMKWEWIVYFARYSDFGASGKQCSSHLLLLSVIAYLHGPVSKSGYSRHGPSSWPRFIVFTSYKYISPDGYSFLTVFPVQTNSAFDPDIRGS